MFESLNEVATTLGRHEGHHSETLMAIVLRGRQLAEAASTMLGDEMESVAGQKAIVNYGSDDPRFQPGEAQS